MGLVRQGDSKYLEDFVFASLQLRIVLYDGHKAISDYRTMDLDAYGIFRRTPELLDTQMLLDPFEEQLHAPTMTVQIRYCLGRGRNIVGQEDVLCTILRVNTDDFA